MSDPQNTRILLARRPRGEPTDTDFEIESQPIPPLADGEILIKILWLSLDPYMRGRMSDRKSYAPPTELGQPIVGEAAGVVAESRSDRWNEGDHVCARSGWQSYYVTQGDDPSVYEVDAKASPLSSYLGVLGMPGRTAYFGLLRIGKPQAGETVVVSAAAGAVGSVVGQIAKIRGCRAVGVAGGAGKCRHVVDELGFDACVDYRAGNLEADLAAACPDGIDVYFENVGGAVTRAVAALLNAGARVPICGFVSAYNAEDMTKEETPFDVLGALANPPEHRFFLVFDFFEEYDEANAQLAEWLEQGKLKYRESVVDGIENAPAAFRGLLRGKNFGKQLIAVAKE
jgi:NADPH-dependent curcumin reductase CurA